MARHTKELPSFSTVAKGDTATLILPLGKTYDHIHIKYSGVTPEQLKNIRVEVNSKSIQEYHDGAQLNAFNKFLGHNVEDGTLDLHFKRDELKTLMEARMYGLGTASFHPKTGEPFPDPINTVVIKIDIDGGAAAPVLKATALQSEPAPVGMISKMRNFPVALNGGINHIDRIKATPTASLAALHVVTSAVVEKMEVYADNQLIFQADTETFRKIQRDHGRDPQAGVYSADFILEGDMLQAISMDGVQDLRVLVHTASDTPAATTAYVFQDWFDTFRGM